MFCYHIIFISYSQKQYFSSETNGRPQHWIWDGKTRPTVCDICFGMTRGRLRQRESSSHMCVIHCRSEFCLASLIVFVKYIRWSRYTAKYRNQRDAAPSPLIAASHRIYGLWWFLIKSNSIKYRSSTLTLQFASPTMQPQFEFVLSSFKIIKMCSQLETGK
jgi:hypothetical protein